MNRDRLCDLVPGDGRLLFWQFAFCARRAEFARPASSSPVAAAKQPASCLRVTVRTRESCDQSPKARGNRPLVAHLRRTAENLFVLGSPWNVRGRWPIPPVRLFAASEEGSPLAKVVLAGVAQQISFGAQNEKKGGRPEKCLPSVSSFSPFPLPPSPLFLDFCRPGHLLCHKDLRQEKAVVHRLSPMCHRRTDRKSLKRSCLPASSNCAGAWGAAAQTQNCQYRTCPALQKTLIHQAPRQGGYHHVRSCSTVRGTYGPTGM